MIRIAFLSCIVWMVMVGVAPAFELIFTVTNTLDLADVNPGDGNCEASNGQCTLRAAVDEVNVLGVASRILFGNPGMILTVEAEIWVYEDVTIDGFGADFTTIDGGDTTRIFEVAGADLVLLDLTLKRGVPAVEVLFDGGLRVERCSLQDNNAAAGANGGAIEVYPGWATLIDSTFTGNSSTAKGGAVSISTFVTGEGLTISGCTFSSNSTALAGGAVHKGIGSVLLIEDSTFDGNTSYGAGGAIAIEGGPATGSRISGCDIRNNSSFFGGGLSIETDGVDVEIDRTNIEYNSGGDGGGGVYLDTTGTGTVTIRNSNVSVNLTAADGGGLASSGSEIVHVVNSTFALNKARGSGGGLFFSAGRTGALVYSTTIVKNKADKDALENNGSGGGVFVEGGGGLVYLRNTLLADNEDLSTGTFALWAPDCMGSLSSDGYNLIGYTNALCDLGTGGTGDQVGDANTGAIDPRMGTLMMRSWWPTFVYTLFDDSPAVDQADPAGCLDTGVSYLVWDQVGRPREVGGRCDVGAYEVGPLIHLFSNGFENGTLYWDEVVGE